MNKTQITLLLISILENESSPDNVLSTPYLQSRLSEYGVEAARQTVCAHLAKINDLYRPVRFSKKGNVQGYWLEKVFTPAETVILRDAVGASRALSKKNTYRLVEKIDGLLSEGEQDKLPDMFPDEAKTDNDNVPDMIDFLLKAIDGHYPVTFRYYDLTVKKVKAYRRKEAYERIPYALVCTGERYYCVMYSPSHRQFANFRIDKMDNLRIAGGKADTVPFSLKDHLQASFDMYKGRGEVVKIRFKADMAPILFDDFGKNIMIVSSDEEGFTAVLRTAITPTLLSWILCFHDRLTVLAPNGLIEQLKKIAADVQKTYNENKKAQKGDIS